MGNTKLSELIKIVSREGTRSGQRPGIYHPKDVRKYDARGENIARQKIYEGRDYTKNKNLGKRGYTRKK